MKYIILGDIHGKTIWKDILDNESFDLAIFEGDYVDTHGNESPEQQLNNLEDILNYKEDNPEKVILLRGNHDMSELGYSWAKCSGFNRAVFEGMQSLKDRYLRLTQWVFIDEESKYLFSHAGVSSQWLSEVAKLDDIHQINSLEPSEIFGFWPTKMSDYYGTSPTQPPTWIRPQTLVECMVKDYTQIVGHTPVLKGIQNIGGIYRSLDKIMCEDLWLCDALDLNSYLVIEDNIFIPRELITL